MSNNKITSVDYDEEKKSKVNQDKNTKKKSNAQKAIPFLIIAIVSLVIILVCTLIAYYQVYRSSKQNKNTLEGVYTSSYFSMVDNVNNLAVDIAKYGTLNTTTSKLSTLQDMMGDCNYILAGLSVLPIEQTNVVAATKFFNQVNGVCEAYMTALNKGESLSQEQELLLDEIGLVLNKIKANFNIQNEGMYDTNFNFTDAGIFDNTGMNELSASMGDMTSASIDYPAMIFDGPFSTALESTVVKGLPNDEVSQEDAITYLKDTVYKGREVNIQFDKETNGDISTYDFTVTIEGKDYSAQVSKRGGLLLTLSSYAEMGDAILGSQQASEMGKTFANNIGYENMEIVWLEVDENVAYINLASVQDGIILYPDLVKVKVDLTSQEIIGFEAVNYALNHVDREYEFTLSESDVEDVLGFDYNILKVSECIIRLDSGVERACYEFMTERIDGMYFYYIDANTSEILKTMKLVDLKGVEKLI